MNAEIVNRIDQIIKAKKLTVNSFAAILGYKQSEKLSRLFRVENAYPSYQIIYDITNKFEDINGDWLITGRGQMYINKDDHARAHERSVAELESELQVCRDKITQFQQFVDMQKEMIDVYRELAGKRKSKNVKP